MDLILWRHAEAENTTPDHDRALTARGRKQARDMAKWLKAHIKGKVKVIASSALRAQQTARPFAQDVVVADELAVGASPHEVLRLAGWPSGDSTIVIVGHQPTLGQVASLLLAGKDANGQIKKGAVWWFRTRGAGLDLETLLHAVVSPELL